MPRRDMTNVDHAPYAARWMDHVRALAHEIGPRGSTTSQERKGAEYCQGVLAHLGLQARMDFFSSASSIYFPHLLASAIMLAAFALYPLLGRWSAGLATLLSLLALVSDLLELSFRDNPLRRWVPQGDSQNVVAVIPPAQEHRQDLILVGHVDSHRTPLIFRSPRWVSVYKAFTTVVFVLFCAQVVLYALGTLTQWSWVWPASIASAVGALLLAAMCLQADRTPYSAGANDNATGAGLVLALAENLQSEPLWYTRVWLACTGCEEVQHYGAIDFFRRYRDKMLKPMALVFEMLGCAGPAWLTQEGIIVPFRADPRLVNLAQRLAAEMPQWGAHAAAINGGNTEMADALRAGVPALTLIGMTPEGEMPYWHQVEDTVDKIDPQALKNAYAFTWALMQSLDIQGLE
jgi:hypothetical protein